MINKLNAPKIVLFGAGNVAIHLADALVYAGYQIVQIYSRTMDSAEPLAKRVNASAITNFKDVELTADLFIFSINDDVLPEIIPLVPFSGQLAIHTSGTVPMDIFKGYVDNYGVMYPLQTFSKFRKLNFKEIPLIIEAGTPKDLTNIKMLAGLLSARVVIANSNLRRQIHLAGIFASNFTNHMYSLSEQLIRQSGLSFDLLKPLIYETAQKALEASSPVICQSGPAVRNNKTIMNKHVEMLSKRADLLQLYQLISESIITLHANEKDN